MAYSKFVLYAILAVSLLLSGAETKTAVGHRLAKCCNHQPQFGKCDTKKDDDRCTKMCMNGCSTNKGGGCQPILAAPGSGCLCYC
ncbi:hypothetical protein CARUB_v10002673mg [Capsella rubella]|uniref:Knottin scorpion toxin-like domain-containing protein n=1 Tax=Capsella rubella TaxID=81985 RepID=R0FJ66_9BRAS|nr:defensin-like protein 24 [Capsella rubella]EOA22116.1 hypothetical protein CARUB_v10002673mg [Capsella rubella]